MLKKINRQLLWLDSCELVLGGSHWRLVRREDIVEGAELGELKFRNVDLPNLRMVTIAYGIGPSVRVVPCSTVERITVDADPIRPSDTSSRGSDVFFCRRAEQCSVGAEDFLDPYGEFDTTEPFEFRIYLAPC
ncbi:MAG TPA: hypothetical protein QF873_01795 [Patescibacteria group bacterium]|nr:hypothetical protein [Patescibacteria group bacterium]